MMCSYGALNVSNSSSSSSMVPDCADGNLINGVLRKSWNWSGFVVSDCDAVQGIEGHLRGIEHQAAAALAINNGVDLNCGPNYGNFLAPVRRMTARFSAAILSWDSQLPFCIA